MPAEMILYHCTFLSYFRPEIRINHRFPKWEDVNLHRWHLRYHKIQLSQFFPMLCKYHHPQSSCFSVFKMFLTLTCSLQLHTEKSHTCNWPWARQGVTSSTKSIPRSSAPRLNISESETMSRNKLIFLIHLLLIHQGVSYSLWLLAYYPFLPEHINHFKT